jgi:glycosyltransferase involved in cell wall biosynthesis
MRILIATSHVPYIRGGAELHAEGLREALRASGHQAEIVAVPFKWYPPEAILDHMLACRLLDLTEVVGAPVDLLIGLKFPAYLAAHPNKVLWILHQHRTAYELWDHPLGDLIYAPNGLEVRDAIRHADRTILSRARAIYANSANVAARLKKYCDLDSTPLYHPPPGAELFYSEAPGDYLFFPSRLCPSKRQTLVLEALKLTTEPVMLRFAGAADSPGYERNLQAQARKLKVEKRVEWLGEITEAEKRAQYAGALGVVYPPTDEDYGYVTLEAMLASKPLITCTDSGGPLEFVLDGDTGRVVEPTPQAIAGAMDELWQNRARVTTWGKSARERYDAMNLTWRNVVRTLLS